MALSTTLGAVVYAGMLELGFHCTEYGKPVRAASFFHDLGAVLPLGFLFAPFAWRTLVFAARCARLLFALPFLTRWFFDCTGGSVPEMETKYLLFLLFGMGGVAAWAVSEAVLPACRIAMMSAGTTALGLEG